MTDKPSGFTLIEVIMTIAIFSVIAYGVIALVSNLFSNARQQGSLLTGADQARKVAFNLTNELRNAATGANGAYSIGQADNQQLVFYANIDNTPDVEKIRYYLSAGKLYKGVTKPTGSVYNPGNESVIAVEDNVANGGNPLFYYYDGSYDGTVDNFLAQPVNIPLIRAIKLNLQVYKTGGVANTTTYTVTALGTVRNLKTNLGN